MTNLFSGFYWDREKKRDRYSNQRDIIVLFEGDISDDAPLTISLHAVLTNNERLLLESLPILYQSLQHLVNIDRLAAFKIIQSKLDNANVTYTINNESDKNYHFNLTIEGKNRLQAVAELLSLGMKPIHPVSLDKIAESQENLHDFCNKVDHNVSLTYFNNYGPESSVSNKSLFHFSPTIHSLRTKLNQYTEKVKTRCFYAQAEQRKTVVTQIKNKIAQLEEDETLTDTEKLKKLIAHVKGCIEATLLDHKQTSNFGIFSFITTPELVKALRNAISHLPKSLVESIQAEHVPGSAYEKEKNQVNTVTKKR